MGLQRIAEGQITALDEAAALLEERTLELGGENLIDMLYCRLHRHISLRIGGIGTITMLNDAVQQALMGSGLN